MADFRARQRVQIHDGTNEFGVVNDYPIFMRVTDTTNDAVFVVINDLYGATPVTFPIAGKYELSPTVYGTGDAVPFLTDANGRLSVTVSTMAAASNIFTDDTEFVVTEDTVAAIGFLADENTPATVTEGNIGLPRMTLDRKILTRIVGATDTYRWDINSAGQGPVDIAAQTLTALAVSATSAANTQPNPIYVQIVSGVISAIEKHIYDTTANVLKDNTDNHDYVPAGTFLLKSIIVASSGAMKSELQVGPAADLATTGIRAVIFTSGAKPTKQIFFDPPIEVPTTSTGTIRIVRRNDDHTTMDVYSTIFGTEL